LPFSSLFSFQRTDSSRAAFRSAEPDLTATRSGGQPPSSNSSATIRRDARSPSPSVNDASRDQTEAGHVQRERDCSRSVSPRQPLSSDRLGFVSTLAPKRDPHTRKRQPFKEPHRRSRPGARWRPPRPAPGAPRRRRAHCMEAVAPCQGVCRPNFEAPSSGTLATSFNRPERTRIPAGPTPRSPVVSVGRVGPCSALSHPNDSL